jgi:hypothetical protein
VFRVEGIAMDLGKVIQDLYGEKEKLVQIIKALEELHQPGAVGIFQPKRRGRKSMGEAERLEVAARMTKYWAKRRAAKAGDAAAVPGTVS